LRLIGFDKIQPPIVWRDLNAVGALNIRCREDACELAGRVNPINRGTI
jgi:hypothetical protein